MDQANQMREANAAALELTATLPVKSLPLGDSGVDVGLFTPPFAQARSWALRLYRYREELAARDDDHVRDDDDATQFDLIVEAVGLCTGASHDEALDWIGRTGGMEGPLAQEAVALCSGISPEADPTSPPPTPD